MYEYRLCDIQSKAFSESKAFAVEALDRDCLDLFIQSLNKVLSCILIIGGVSYIISKSSLIILIAIAVSLAINLYNDYLNARHNFTDTKEQVEYRRKSSYLQSISSDFAFAKEIRLFNLKDRFHKRMDEVEQLLFRARESRRKERHSSAVLSYAAEGILDISMYLFYGYQVLVTATISLGEFSLYINALRQLKSSVDDIIYTLTDFVVNTEYLDGFFTFIEQKVNLANIESNPVTVSAATVQFENVYFRYPNATQYTLKNINITINAGETLLIVGENGAGKSTFAKLYADYIDLPKDAYYSTALIYPPWNRRIICVIYLQYFKITSFLQCLYRIMFVLCNRKILMESNMHWRKPICLI